jgi:hypothetical protein
VVDAVALGMIETKLNKGSGVGDQNLTNSTFSGEGLLYKDRVLVPDAKTRNQLLACLGDPKKLKDFETKVGREWDGDIDLPSTAALVKTHANFLSGACALWATTEDSGVQSNQATFLRSLVKNSSIFLGVIKRPELVKPILTRVVADSGRVSPTDVAVLRNTFVTFADFLENRVRDLKLSVYSAPAELLPVLIRVAELCDPQLAPTHVSSSEIGASGEDTSEEHDAMYGPLPLISI